MTRRIAQTPLKRPSPTPKRKVYGMYIFSIGLKILGKEIAARVIASDEERALEILGFTIFENRRESPGWKKSAKVKWKLPLKGKHKEGVQNDYCTRDIE